ncbi:MAG: ATP-binding protein [Gemmatimonadales bacterium]|nr:MAG: ATP-binding protein [Gemmatimonadales bacterium]
MSPPAPDSFRSVRAQAPSRDDATSPSPALVELQEALGSPRSGWILVHGPAGTGRSRLLSRAVQARGGLLFRASPLGAEDLLDDFRTLLLERRGTLPRPEGPGFLPEPGGLPGWRTLLVGLVDQARKGHGPTVLAFDGARWLLESRRRWASEVAEALERARRRGAPVHLILVLDGVEPDLPHALPPPTARIRTGALDLREAARAHGGRDPLEQYALWACLGGDPSRLPSGSRHPGSESGASSAPSEPNAGSHGRESDGPADGEGRRSRWETLVAARVLAREGDLFDAPLRELDRVFQKPARYVSLLRALSEGPLDWPGLRARVRGVQTGGQMAPYLARLESLGVVESLRPLGSPEGSRDRRYRIRDPFLAFWMGCVLPVRSLVDPDDPWPSWVRWVRPRVSAHLERCLPRATADWFRRHARERFSAPGREVGALWGGEAEFPVVGWLANGQICYVETEASGRRSGARVFDDLAEKMRRTRYGIGRQARTPVLVLPRGIDEGLRRRMAREPLTTVLDLSDLMGTVASPGAPGWVEGPSAPLSG